MLDRFAALLAVAALAGASSAQQTQDSIKVIGNDKPIKGKIVEETLAEIVVQLPQGRTTVKWETVEGQPTYGEGEAIFKPVVDAMAKNDGATAIARLEAMKPTDLRPIFVPRRLFLMGQAFEMQGKTKEAEEKFAELVSKHPQNRYVRDATKALVSVQIKNKNFSGAVSTADLGIKLAQDGKLDGLALEFRTVKASVLEAQDKFSEADSEYRAVASAAASVAPKVATLANVGQGRIAARQGDFTKAKMLLEPALKSNDPTILGPAYAAMGEACLAEGLKLQNADKLREAAWDNYMRVVVQFPPSSLDSADSLELAMFGSVRAYHTLAKLEKGKDGDLWSTYGINAASDFMNRFNSSRWFKQVDELRKDFKPSAPKPQ